MIQYEFFSKSIEINYRNKHLLDCSGGNLTPAGNRGKWETPAGRAEEAPIPPRGKQVPAAEIHGI
jgi:hypothetical protein